MTNRERALLEMVVANPDDDGPRLVYADWLEENGECDRAEFIRIQIELEKHSQQFDSLASRERELLISNRLRWLPKYLMDLESEHGGYAFEYGRGFPSAVTCTLLEWVGGECQRCRGSGWVDIDYEMQKNCTTCRSTGRIGGHGPAIVAAAPVTRVVLNGITPLSGQWYRVGNNAIHPQSDLPDSIFDLLNLPITMTRSGLIRKKYPSNADAIEALCGPEGALIRWARIEADKGRVGRREPLWDDGRVKK